MSGAVVALDLAVHIGQHALAVVVARRPSRRWRAGWAGKLISLVAALVVAFHFGALPVPLGAIIGLVRHRHDRRRRHDRSPVAMADSWPGA